MQEAVAVAGVGRDGALLSALTFGHCGGREPALARLALRVSAPPGTAACTSPGERAASWSKRVPCWRNMLTLLLFPSAAHDRHARLGDPIPHVR
jgi:hypothetical protein